MGRDLVLSNRNYVQYPRVIAIGASDVTYRLTCFVDEMIHKHMVIDSSFIYLDGRVKIPSNGPGLEYIQHLDTFLLAELREAIVNNICYNVLIRIKNNELDTLIRSTQSVDLFYSVFAVGYSVDRRRLTDVLLDNNNRQNARDFSVNPVSMWNSEEMIIDYIDNFNSRVQREIFNMIKFIMNIAAERLVMYFIQLAEKIYDKVMQLFDEQKISLTIRPISVFVSTQSYDLMLLN